MLGGHVLRSQDRPGLEQEIWALLTVYQLLRMAMVDAVETRPGTDPDRASFTTALQAARDQLTAARGVHPDDPADLPGVIGRAVLATLLPARRPATAPARSRTPPPATSTATTADPAASTTITAIEITLHTPPIDTRPRPRRAYGSARQPRPPTRRHRVTAIMNTDPGRGWTGSELADPAPGQTRATCSPNSPNGPASASSPAPAPAPTPSTHRHRSSTHPPTR